MATLAQPVIRDVRVIAIVGAAHGGSHFFHLVLPPLFPLLSVRFQVGYAELGLLVSLFFATSGLCQTPAGFLVDRVGAARVLGGGLLCLAIGALLAALAPSYPALVPAAILMGLGNSVFHPADYAILGHHVAPRRMARAFSVHTIGGTIGWAIAPVIVAGTAAITSWRVALVLSGLVGLGLAALTLTHRDSLETPAHREPSDRGRAVTLADHLKLFASRPLLLCFLFFALQAIAFIAVQGFMPLSLHQLFGLEMITATATVTAFMTGSAAGTLAGSTLADRGGQLERIIVGGLALSAAILLVIGLMPLPDPVLLVGVALAGALAGATTPSRDLLVRASAPPGGAGKVFGFVYSGLDLGATLTPTFVGALLDAERPGAVFVIAPAAMVLSILIAISLRRPSARTDRGLMANSRRS